MPVTFESAVEFILQHEGGFVDDVHDPGRTTKFGISQRAYPNLDIRSLTKEQALHLYRKDYWERCSCDKLPPALALVLFDAAINQGPSAAIRMMQTALGVRADGVIGSKTIEAAQQTGAKGITEFVARRMNNYGLHPSFSRYGLGWSRRLAQCHQLALEAL